MQTLELRDLRIASGLSAAELARRLALHRSTISRFENLTRYISDDLLDDYVDECLRQARANWPASRAPGRGPSKSGNN